MYNLLMCGDSNETYWEHNTQDTWDKARIFEYTETQIKEKLQNKLEALKKFPCLFTYEKRGKRKKVKAYVGYIKEIKERTKLNGKKEITIDYSFDPEYPVINLNMDSDSDLSDLGIEEGSDSWELNRSHWAVKNKNLFKFISKYFANKFQKTPILKPDEMKNIWGENYENKPRIFFSHKAEYKKQVSDIKNELVKENFSCFVAHEDIEPSLEWQKEIIKALNTMDIFIGIVTNNFHTGSWTDQEIGFAYKRDIPKIFIKLEKNDPKGFVSSEQALAHVTWKNAHEKIVSHIKKHYPKLYNPLSPSDIDWTDF